MDLLLIPIKHVPIVLLIFYSIFLQRYQGIYLGQDVAIKILRSEHLNEASEDEFAQEVAILR